MRTASVARTGVGASAWLPLDPYSTGYAEGLYAKLTSAATYSIEVTPDNIFDPTVTPTAYPCDVAVLTAATTTQSGALLKPARAARINITSGGGTVTLSVVERGVI